ncbi:protein-ribulosamine 3-kinase [Microdochium nivale]|nr:protein-ribulosamine 3-kinase [Microdochium nivale]
MAETQTSISLSSPFQAPADHEGLDSAIVAVLEPGLRNFQVNDYGVSSWARTSRIDCETSGGEPRSYFLKTISANNAADRVYGEYMSMKEIHDTLPSAVPTPRGHGPCNDSPGTHFYVCDYIPVTHELPDPVELGRKLAEFHRKSKPPPNGMFGFYCPTFDGDQIINTTWESSWTEFFKKRIHEAYLLDLERNGHWKEYEDVVRTALDKLIPRLLDALVKDGRSISPVLIHGDLWESNIGTDENTDEIVFWDACAYYAHHEREIAIWRCAHHQMTDEKYRREYFKHFPPSEPREEADDRNRLYSVEILMNNGLSFPGAATRQLAVSELKYLIDKYVA